MSLISDPAVSCDRLSAASYCSYGLTTAFVVIVNHHCQSGKNIQHINYEVVCYIVVASIIEVTILHLSFGSNAAGLLDSSPLDYVTVSIVVVVAMVFLLRL